MKRVTNKAALRALESISKAAEVKVGWVSRITYPDSDFTVAEAASYNEYGISYKGIPPRPFMRTAIADNAPKWQKTSKHAAKQTLKGAPAKDVLELIGQVASGDIRRSIADLYSPALKPATIAARERKYESMSEGGKNRAGGFGIEKPLVDSGTMLNSCTYEVSN